MDELRVQASQRGERRSSAKNITNSPHGIVALHCQRVVHVPVSQCGDAPAYPQGFPGASMGLDPQRNFSLIQHLEQNIVSVDRLSNSATSLGGSKVRHNVAAALSGFPVSKQNKMLVIDISMPATRLSQQRRYMAALTSERTANSDRFEPTDVHE